MSGLRVVVAVGISMELMNRHRCCNGPLERLSLACSYVISHTQARTEQRGRMIIPQDLRRPDSFHHDSACTREHNNVKLSPPEVSGSRRLGRSATIIISNAEAQRDQITTQKQVRDDFAAAPQNHVAKGPLMTSRYYRRNSMV